jgi:hypothetical protein
MDSELNGEDKVLDYTLKQTKETFEAFVEAVIPRSPKLAEQYGNIQYYGALDFLIDEYLIITLNEYHPNLAEATAEMLNVAAEKLILRNENREPVHFNGSGNFSALTPNDRLLALALLKKYQYTSSHLLFPFENIFFNITDNLIRITMMGYYSEWFGYGMTRLKMPNERILEFYPLSWNQVGYPGPVPGHVFKNSQEQKETQV